MRQGSTGASRALALAGIAAIVAALALAFAWTAGWIGGSRLTAQRMTDTLEAGNSRAYPGYRRAHAKGICVSGNFTSSGAAATLTTARILAPGQLAPVLGRLSIAGADPQAPDPAARVRSMALLLRSDDGQQWRTAMNSFPFFPFSTPEEFHAQLQAALPDPATGKPDPARLAAILERNPGLRRFQAWAGSAPWSDSWANTEFNSVNAFVLLAPDGTRQPVRWSMQPQAPFQEMTPGQRQQAGGDFLAQDLRERLSRGPLRWDLVLTLAAPDDPVNDPSQPWSEDRTRVVAGTLELTEASEEATGACRDVNFDPLILPTGIAASEDPVLLARAAVYAESFNRREREIARGEKTGAAGQEPRP